jgi:hypothetical protein
LPNSDNKFDVESGLLSLFPSPHPFRYNTCLTVTRRWPSAAVSSGTMLALLLVSLISAFVLLCLFVPSVRMSIMAVDDSLDAHEAGLALVAARMCIY